MKAVLALCLFASVASADNNPNQAEADKYFAEGRALLPQVDLTKQTLTDDQKKLAKAACEKFEKAIELDPEAPGVMLNLGLCYEMQDQYATSLYWFRKAQVGATEAGLKDHKEEAEIHTRALAAKVFIAKIDISQAPAGVRVLRDGRQVRPEDYLRLEVNRDSTIEARAPGKEPFQETVTIENETDRKAKDIVIVMKDEVVPPMVDPGKGRRRLAYIVGAGGVVIWGVTLWYGLAARSKYEDMPNKDNYDDAYRKLRFYDTGLFIAGTAAVGAAFVLFFTAPKPYRERKQQAFVPLVSPDQVGFGYARSF